MNFSTRVEMLAKAILTNEDMNENNQSEVIKELFERVAKNVEEMSYHTFKYVKSEYEQLNQSEVLAKTTLLLSDEKEYVFSFIIVDSEINDYHQHIKDVKLLQTKKHYKNITQSDIECMLDYIIKEKKDIGCLYDRKLVIREWLKLNDYDPFNAIDFDPKEKIVSFENADAHTAYTIKRICIPGIDKEVELLIRQCNGRLKGYRFC